MSTSAGTNMKNTGDFQAIVLAAGKGSRMGSELPKVLLPILGRPMLAHILDVLTEAGIPRPVAVVGKGSDFIRAALGDSCVYARQIVQRGSGHAVACAREAAGKARNILVVCGDSPLFRAETVRSLMAAHIREGATITLTSAILEDPRGYGRILREAGEVVGIAEEKIATDEQKAIREINGGCYAFDARWLWLNLGEMRENDAGEYCLTEMVDVAIRQDKRVITVSAEEDEVAGVNTPEQLQTAERILAQRVISHQ